MDVQTALHATKKISITPNWVEGDDDRLWISVPLEIEGVTLQGLNLRARVFKNRPDEDVLFQLEYEHDVKRKDKAIERIDWLPSHVHDNKGNGPPEHRFVRQTSSHYHRFELNWLPIENRLKSDNLPIAVPLGEEVKDFSALLAFVGKNFRIANIELIEQPGWEPVLF